MSGYLLVALDIQVVATYSAGRDLSDIDAKSLTQAHRNSSSSPADWSQGSGGTKTRDESCEAKEDSISLLHVDLTEDLVQSSWTDLHGGRKGR